MEIKAPAVPPLRRPVWLLLGAFAFAFCIGTTVHELGHYVVDRLVGIPDVRVILHPFASPRIVIPGGFPDQLRGWPDAAGPLANIALSTIAAALLWRIRTPAILPLLLWAPMAYVQEGFSSALGLLEPGSDSAWIVSVGVPAVIVLAASLLLLAAGLVGMELLLPLLGIAPDDSFGSKLGILAGGMGSFMAILFLYNAAINSSNAGEVQRGVVLLVFVLLLATLLAAIHGPLHQFLKRLSRTNPAQVTRPAVVAALSMASAVVLVGLLLWNA